MAESLAYFGGSITAAWGWRVKTTAWLKSHYPNANMVEINAAISGTGSEFGACRIAEDVLSKNPDLVFMEHRVNEGNLAGHRVARRNILLCRPDSGCGQGDAVTHPGCQAG